MKDVLLNHIRSLDNNSDNLALQHSVKQLERYEQVMGSIDFEEVRDITILKVLDMEEEAFKFAAATNPPNIRTSLTMADQEPDPKTAGQCLLVPLQLCRKNLERMVCPSEKLQQQLLDLADKATVQRRDSTTSGTAGTKQTRSNYSLQEAKLEPVKKHKSTNTFVKLAEPVTKDSPEFEFLHASYLAELNKKESIDRAFRQRSKPRVALKNMQTDSLRIIHKSSSSFTYGYEGEPIAVIQEKQKLKLKDPWYKSIVKTESRLIESQNVNVYYKPKTETIHHQKKEQGHFIEKLKCSALALGISTPSSSHFKSEIQKQIQTSFQSVSKQHLVLKKKMTQKKQVLTELNY